jgi:hypothetical protein
MKLYYIFTLLFFVTSCGKDKSSSSATVQSSGDVNTPSLPSLAAKVVEIKRLKVVGQIRSSVEDGKGGIFIGGEFSSVEGMSVKNFAHILPDGKVDDAYREIGASDAIYALAYDLSQNTIYMGGFFSKVFDQSGEVESSYIGAMDLNLKTAVKEVANLRPDYGVYSLALDDQALYIGGGFREIAGKVRDLFALYSLKEKEITDFELKHKIYDGDVSVIRLQGDYIYLGGGFYSIELVPGKSNETLQLLAKINKSTGEVSYDYLNGRLGATTSITSTQFGHVVSTWGGWTKEQSLFLIEPSSAAVLSAYELNGSVMDVKINGSIAYVAGDLKTYKGQKVSKVIALNLLDGSLVDIGLTSEPTGIYQLPVVTTQEGKFILYLQ